MTTTRSTETDMDSHPLLKCPECGLQAYQFSRTYVVADGFDLTGWDGDDTAIQVEYYDESWSNITGAEAGREHLHCRKGHEWEAPEGVYFP